MTSFKYIFLTFPFLISINLDYNIAENNGFLKKTQGKSINYLEGNLKIQNIGNQEKQPFQQLGKTVPRFHI